VPENWKALGNNMAKVVYHKWHALPSSEKLLSA
jgi:hypothetical protein